MGLGNRINIVVAANSTVIDDTGPSNDKTYSSAKIEDIFKTPLEVGDMLKSAYDTGETTGTKKVDRARLADKATIAETSNKSSSSDVANIVTQNGENYLINPDFYFWQRGANPIPIISRGRTNSINTYTTDRPHGYVVGDSIQITGVAGKNLSTEKCTWTFIVTAVPSPTSFGCLCGWGSSAAMTAAQTTLTLNDLYGNTETMPFNIKVESEEMTVTAKNGLVFTVTRGVNGTTAVAHAANLPVALANEATVADTGKCIIINRPSFALLAGQNIYTADRKFVVNATNQPCVVSRQSFTAGQTQVPGNPKYFMRANFATAPTTGYIGVEEFIEDVETLADKTVTLSMYTQAPNAVDQFITSVGQIFNGSPSIYNIGVKNTISATSWVKNTNTIDVPSLAGKIMGDGNCSLVSTSFNPRSAGNYDFAMMKLEEGTIATPLKPTNHATELIKCQRYFEKSYNQGQAVGILFSGNGMVFNSTAINCVNYTPYKVVKRKYATTTIYSHATGASGFVYDAYAYIDKACSAGWYGESGFHLLGLTSVVGNEYRYHWTADAELY